jgi:hypothetical protein
MFFLTFFEAFQGYVATLTKSEINVRLFKKHKPSFYRGPMRINSTYFT